MAFKTTITFDTEKAPQGIELLTVLQALSKIKFDALSKLARDCDNASQIFRVSFLTVTIMIERVDMPDD